MRQMKDSTNWAAIPVSTQLVAGYVPPSSFAWPSQAWARFTGSILVKITPSASVHGAGVQVLDVEKGDATPAQVPGWVSASLGAGQEPTTYCNLATWPAVISACLNAGTPVPQAWVAEWDGVQTLPTVTVNGVTYTAIAKQYADPAHGSGGDWDASIVANFWPGIDQGQGVDMTPEEHAWLQALYGAFYVTASTPYGETIFDGEKNIEAAETAEQTALGNIATLVKGVQAGTVDVAQLAQALVPILAPADAAAFQAAFAAALAK